MLDIAKTAGLLVLSNIFMTFAWYGHLKNLKAEDKSWYGLAMAIMASWGIAFFEYLIQVPANRLGFGANLTLAQLKVMQEVITLCVFVPFALFYMRDNRTPVSDYALAGLCLVAAVFFIFRSKVGA
jgi:uncharacterized protein (DUF486 family)